MKCGTNIVCVCRDATGCVPGLLFGWLSFKCVRWLETFPIMCCSPANSSISQPECRKTNHDSCWSSIPWFSCCWTWSSAPLHAIFMQLPMELEQLYSQSAFAWITLYLIFMTTPWPSALSSTAGKKGFYFLWWPHLRPCLSLPFPPENIPSLRLCSRQWWHFSCLKQEPCEPCRILPLFNKWWCVTWAVSHEHAVSAPSLFGLPGLWIPDNKSFSVYSACAWINWLIFHHFRLLLARVVSWMFWMLIRLSGLLRWNLLIFLSPIPEHTLQIHRWFGIKKL